MTGSLGRPLTFTLSLGLVAAVSASAQPPSPSPAPPPRSSAYTSPAPAPGENLLSLSLDETVKRALENNVDIAVERYNPEDAELAVTGVRGNYDPLLSSTVTQNSSTSRSTSAFAGTDRLVATRGTYNVSADKLLPTGGNARLEFNNARTRNNVIGIGTFNPQVTTGLTASLSQPLLRNFSIDATRYQLRVAKKNHEISDVQFQQTVVNTVAGVKQLYYDLIYAIDNLDAQRKSLDLARQLVDENRIRVRVGTLAPLDVVAAESEQASREENVIVAEAALLEAEDVIKRAIFPTSDPALWAMRIVPTDRPTAEPVRVDLDAAIQKAMANRTDLLSARKGLENAEYNVRYTSNQRLPSLDLVAAYGANAVGGTQFARPADNPLATPVPVNTVGFGDNLGSVFSRDFPTWSLGVNFAYPIFNRQNDANAARARVSRDQTEASMRRLEIQVLREVRSAARAVETNFKRVESTRAARGLQEQRLDAEQKKFAAGMSTNYLVTQAQRDLAFAAVSELQAIADYRKSLVNFDRVQEAGGTVIR